MVLVDIRRACNALWIFWSIGHFSSDCTICAALVCQKIGVLIMDENFYTQYSHGSAAFGKEEDARLLATGNGIIATLGREITRFEPKHPSIILGGAGSGKFAELGAYQLVHPSVQSFFILDVGAQYMSTTWHYNLALGRRVYAINAEGIGAYPNINHPVDLFGILKNDGKLFKNSKLVASLALTETDKHGDNAWVGQGARRWLTRFLTSIVRLEGRVTPKRLVEFIHAVDSDYDYLKSWGMRCQELPNNEYSVFVEINRLKHTSEKQYGGIMGKIKDDLDWLSASEIAETISGNIDYLSWLGDPDKKIGIYYVLEGGTGREMESLTRLVVGIVQIHCIRANKGALPLLYLDEAATCGKAEFIKRSISEFRKYYQTILVYQSAGQLIDLFGKAGAQEIFDGCGTQIYLGGGIRNIDSAKPLAETIGKKTIFINRNMAQAEHAHKAELAFWSAIWHGKDVFEAEHLSTYEMHQSRRQEKMGRYAIDPAELMRLKNQVLILSPALGLHPLLARKLPRYWENPVMAGRYAPDPLFPPLDRITVQGRWRKKTLRFVRRPVPDFLSDWSNHVNGEIAYVQGYKTW